MELVIVALTVQLSALVKHSSVVPEFLIQSHFFSKLLKQKCTSRPYELCVNHINDQLRKSYNFYYGFMLYIYTVSCIIWTKKEVFGRCPRRVLDRKSHTHRENF